MANEIVYFTSTGTQLYAVILNESALIWNGAAFESPTAANWAAYPVALGEQTGSGIFVASIPSGIGSGVYTVALYQRTGSSASSTDTALASGCVRWNGTNEVTSGNVVFGYI